MKERTNEMFVCMVIIQLEGLYMTEERLKKFKNINVLNEIDGFIESLLEEESKSGIKIPDQFNFSYKEYTVFDTLFYLGIIDTVYFLGKRDNNKNEFMFFRNKKMIQMYLNREFEGLDKSVKGFWMKEVELL